MGEWINAVFIAFAIVSMVFAIPAIMLESEARKGRASNEKEYRTFLVQWLSLLVLVVAFFFPGEAPFQFDPTLIALIATVLGVGSRYVLWWLYANFDSRSPEENGKESWDKRWVLILFGILVFFLVITTGAALL